VAPHPPFVIDKVGAYVRPKTAYGFYDGSDYMSVGGTIDSYKEGYGNQARFVSERILEVIQKLQSSGGEPPIIIIQGDHGSKSRLYQNDSKMTDVRESMRNLNAMLVPEDIRKRLYPGLTPVNSFRIILGQLSGQPLPLKPDTSFFSQWSDPFKFEDVTDRVNQPLPQ
jgi:hypothetical protein